MNEIQHALEDHKGDDIAIFKDTGSLFGESSMGWFVWNQKLGVHEKITLSELVSLFGVKGAREFVASMKKVSLS